MVRRTLSDWVDVFTLNAIRQGHQAQAAVGNWLAWYRWQYYVTLTFRHPISHPRAEDAVREWVRTMQRDHYSRFFTFHVIERGLDEGRLHAHVLVGGITRQERYFMPSPLQETRALALMQRTWRGGIVRSAPYDTRRGAVTYVAKNWNDGALVSGEILGQPFRKRKRRAPGPGGQYIRRPKAVQP